MFEVVMKLLNRNQKTSKEIAKDRLKVVLIHHLEFDRYIL